MNVKELIQALNKIPENGRVYFSDEYGDLEKIYTVTMDSDGDTILNEGDSD